MSKSYKTEDIDALQRDTDINENTTKRTTWFSIPSELLNDPNFESRIKDFSPHYFLFHCYLKTRMLGNEKYYIFEKDNICKTMLHLIKYIGSWMWIYPDMTGYHN